MLKPMNLVPVGTQEHRSGWPYCLESLTPLYSKNGPFIFDDFIERTFLYHERYPRGHVGHLKPWVGMVHHPVDIPDWYLPSSQLQDLDSNERWQRSLPNLRLLISFGDALTNWLREKWPTIPVETVHHPTGRAILNWTPEAFFQNHDKQLVQVGWFLRNTHAIYQVTVPELFRKVCLRRDSFWVQRAHKTCGDNFAPDRTYTGQVEFKSRLSDFDYDFMLSRNVVFLELVSAAANNTVVECIARNTPICINRHPGPEYYLGKNYPLFYDHLSQVPELLTMERILAAHQYLKLLPKAWIRGGVFCETVRSVCCRHLPECRSFATPVNDQPKILI